MLYRLKRYAPPLKQYILLAFYMLRISQWRPQCLVGPSTCYSIADNEPSKSMCKGTSGQWRPTTKCWTLESTVGYGLNKFNRIRNAAQSEIYHSTITNFFFIQSRLKYRQVVHSFRIIESIPVEMSLGSIS